MATLNQHIMSRRGFCLCCMAATTVAATGGWLSPRQAFAEARNIVDLIRDDAAKAPIKVHKLRNIVSILEGSGGNIAVMNREPYQSSIPTFPSRSLGLSMDALSRHGEGTAHTLQRSRRLVSTWPRGQPKSCVNLFPSRGFSGSAR
jgi:hypothetical protein